MSSAPGAVKGFQDLMRRRVHDIVLVSSLYDSFILSEDGQLDGLILSGALALHERNVPGITRVSTGAEALDLARTEPRYNLIISSTHAADMDALALARQTRECGLDVPVILLGYDYRQLKDFVTQNDVSPFGGIFLWQGDVNILLAIVKLVEDQWNVAHDTGLAGVQAIILIEDHVRFYSSFVPAIYAELMHQSERLLPEALNASHRLLRLRARPKVLLCRTYEEAWDAFTTYEEHVLGVVSDIEFPRHGRLCATAGSDFARTIRERQPDVPVMLQSSHARNEAVAREAGAAFLLKRSPTLLHELRQFVLDHFGFGDFVFRMPEGGEVGRAHDLKGLEDQLRTVPVESIGYHAERNHFSRWLKARTEFALADRLRPRRISDFATLEDLRLELIRAIQDYREHQHRLTVTDFDRRSFDPRSGVSRIGSGSLGGKARGLAFASHLLATARLPERFPGVRVVVPPFTVLATDVFEELVERDGLRDLAITSDDEAEIVRRFERAELPGRARDDLAHYAALVDRPIAVRSSSLLEDSMYRPFAGVYATCMLPNDDADPHARLARLRRAIATVYASTYSRHAKAYLAGTPHRLEEEKMAIVLQPIVGARHGPRVYPDIAGVARSVNHYPIAPMRPEDGIMAVALGFGMTVVEGGTCLRVCPRFPRHRPQHASARDAVRNSQRAFQALRMGTADGGGASAIQRFALADAEQDGTLPAVASTYSADNDRLYSGTTRPGTRVVTFAPILEHGLFPLAGIVDVLLQAGKEATAADVEIEFAVNLSVPRGRPPEFALLQLRPMAARWQGADIDLTGIERSEVVCHSRSVLGHGRIDDICDIVVVDMHGFDRARSRHAAGEVTRYNALLVEQGRPYLLIGVGRWGSADPYLGIPVTWDQIAGARVIVEAGFRDLMVAPSQGTHFFHNLTACGVGYFTVNPDAGEGFVDWAWLKAQVAADEGPFVRHLRFASPLGVVMDGGRNEGVILKPAPLAP